MDLKFFLGRFWQLANVIRIIGVQALSAFCIAYVLGKLAVILGVRGCPSAAGFFNYFLLVFTITGVAATIVGLYYILFPAIWLQKIDRQLVFSSSDLSVPFLSTRPVYLFLDAGMLIPAITLLIGGIGETMCQFNFEWVFGWSFLGMVFLFPVARTVSWYFLRRRIEAKHVRIPWTTLILWWILTVPAALVLSYFYYERHVSPRLRSPIVSTESFQGGFDKNPGFSTGIVRVRGKLVREVLKCGISNKAAEKLPYPASTVLLDMGPGNGQIMVKAGTVEQVELLGIEAADKVGKTLEAYGRLSSLPNLSKKNVCGLEKVATAQNGGLALLELELPRQK